eukprot:Rmarinus@m.10303
MSKKWRPQWDTWRLSHVEASVKHTDGKKKALLDLTTHGIRRREGGIPPEHRPRAWMALMFDMKDKVSSGEPSFKDFLEMVAEGQLTPTEIEINKDLDRTHILSSDEDIARLRNVLYAYARRNPSVGYCQGMNIIAAVLLQHLKDADAFWVLAVMVEIIMPRYFTKNMEGVHVDQLVLNSLLAKYHPHLHQHLRHLGVSMQHFCTQWFVVVFANVTSREVYLHIWDYYFGLASVHGSQACRLIISFAITVLTRNTDAILECCDAGEVMSVLAGFIRDTLGGNGNEAKYDRRAAWSVLNEAFEMVEALDADEIAGLRELALKDVSDTLQTRSDDMQHLDLCDITHFRAEELAALRREFRFVQEHSLRVAAYEKAVEEKANAAAGSSPGRRASLAAEDDSHAPQDQPSPENPRARTSVNSALSPVSEGEPQRPRTLSAPTTASDPSSQQRKQGLAKRSEAPSAPAHAESDSRRPSICPAEWCLTLPVLEKILLPFGALPSWATGVFPLAAIFRAFDTSRQGRATFQQFVITFSQLWRGKFDDRVTVIFRMMDIDSSEYIEEGELVTFIEELFVLGHLNHVLITALYPLLPETLKKSLLKARRQRSLQPGTDAADKDGKIETATQPGASRGGSNTD